MHKTSKRQISDLKEELEKDINNLETPLKDLGDKFAKFSKIFDINTESIETITENITENVIHSLDKENLNGLLLADTFELVKKELIKKDKEIESLKARLDILESIIKVNKKKKIYLRK